MKLPPIKIIGLTGAVQKIKRDIDVELETGVLPAKKHEPLPTLKDKHKSPDKSPDVKKTESKKRPKPATVKNEIFGEAAPPVAKSEDSIDLSKIHPFVRQLVLNLMDVLGALKQIDTILTLQAESQAQPDQSESTLRDGPLAADPDQLELFPSENPKNDSETKGKTNV